jgi:FkbM family methyltransferase
VNWKKRIQRLSIYKPFRKTYDIARGFPVLGSALKRFSSVAVPTDARVWVTIPSGPGNGLWLHLNPRFETEYLEGNYEPAIERILLSHLRPGGVFYDVGAHIGVFSMIAARCVGPNGSVFAFEPEPLNFRRIEQQASRNWLDERIRVIPKAAWSSKGRLHFQRGTSSTNTGAIAEGASAAEQSAIEVETVTLDDIAREYVFPTLIKIDVEGAEAAVLRGSVEIIRSAKPLLICEIHHEQASIDVIRWLQSHGYVFEWLDNRAKFPRHVLAKFGG